ncbi:MAG: SDR family oxidoreductase, partial [Acidobacteria bacterium]|nr:SDR family oxidoreductase [Acidobacteriota bacterium]
MKIAITGATGQLGGLTVRALKEKGFGDSVVALARTASKAGDLGVEVREADYNHPETLETALQGIDKLLLVSSNEVGKRAEQHQNVIDAAKRAGVESIVYTSLLRADTSQLNLAAEHAATEAALKASGISFTILRNGWYTENYTASIASALENGAFYGSAGDGQISSAARSDYAEAAAVVLTTDDHEGKTYELAGDVPYTLTELSEEISKQTGRSIPYTDVPEEEYAKALLGAGLPELWANAYASWDTGVK